jgi:hypothetical protein
VKRCARLLLVFVRAALFALTLPAISSGQALRPPATPLVAVDPYFSLWSFADRLTDENTRHWTGRPQPVSLQARIDGKTVRLAGRDPSRIPALEQVSLTVRPTTTRYEFRGEGVGIAVDFVTPALPHDLDWLTRPVTFVRWAVRSLDGRPHAVKLLLTAAAHLVVNTTDQRVMASRIKAGDAQVLRIGSQEQPMLVRWGDDVRIDWGFFYVASRGDAASAVAPQNESWSAFARDGSLPEADDVDFPRPAGTRTPSLALAIDAGQVGADPVSRLAVLAYDDLFSVEFMNRRLRPYWRRNGADAMSLVRTALEEAPKVIERAQQYDDELMRDAEQTGGPKYAALVALAHRQALAAQKVVADVDGTPLMFSKENFSNGCIGTVDVMYPAMPQLLLLNPELAKATLRPILEYAGLPRWRFPFAPHDLGTYPLANGQVYGGGERTEENQMPVEESANLLILVDAVAAADGNARFAEPYWKQLASWAEYLAQKGLDPENQLCTDDFAGHLARNANLSVKAIVGLGAYADLCRRGGRTADATKFAALAKDFARKWIELARDGNHFKLTFDGAGTWSQKYNLVWDRMLGLNLFTPDIAKAEVAYYTTKLQPYGLPLDNRRTYTKLDWEIWTATLADTRADFDAFVGPIYRWMNETKSRVPLTDWYDTVSGAQEGFQARSVVGGVFIKMLADPAVTRKWQQRAMAGTTSTR